MRVFGAGGDRRLDECLGGLLGRRRELAGRRVPSSSGAEPGAGDVADFTALPVGETVTLTNYTAIGSLWFSGSADDLWTVTGAAWVSPTRRISGGSLR